METKLKQNNSGTAVLTVCMMTSLITTFMGSALNLSIPHISAEFNMGATSVGWIVTSYILTVTAMSVPFGRLADLTGKVRILILGEFLFTVFALMTVFAWDETSILIFRIGQGVGAAAIFATNTALLTESFPPQKRGQVIGLSVTAVYLGLSLGPVAGGVMEQYFGWKSIFYLSAAWTAVTLIIAILKVRADESTAKLSEYVVNLNESEKFSLIKHMDIRGCILYMMSIVLIVYGFSSLSSRKSAVAVLVAGMALIALFIFNEKRVAFPLISIDLIKENKVFAYSNLAALLNYAASFAITYVLSIYLQNLKGMTSAKAGIILIVSPILQTLLSPFAGRMSDRIKPGILASVGMGVTAAGIFLMIFISENSGLGFIIATLAIIGTGFAFFSSPNTNAIMSSVEKKDLSIASSMLATGRSLGQSVSMGIVTVIVAAILGNTALKEVSHTDMIFAMKVIFIVMTVLCAVGVWFSSRRN